MTDTRTVTIVDPTAEDVAERFARAPRLASLEGRTIGLIDNSKRMADAFLAEIEDLLRKRHGVAGVRSYQKSSPSVLVPPAELAALVSSVDGVVHAVAD